MIIYGCIICDDIVFKKNTMCSGCKEAYEKGVRDMWVKARRISQFCFTCNNVADKTCVIDNCPIAKKLLKAVK